MTYVVHITINYPEGEEIEYTWKAPTEVHAGQMIVGYLKEDTPSSWVFVVTREEAADSEAPHDPL